MTKGATKIFVFDTNVILHDHSSINHFEDNDIVIPITVLEELDKFKKGSDLINFQAREFMRVLDNLTGDYYYDEGIPLGPNQGRLFIETGKPFSEAMRSSNFSEIADHQILAVAHYIHSKHENQREVILVSKDINLRMKAKSLGVKAQDYETDKVRNIDDLYKGIKTIEDIDDALIARMYKEHNGILAEEFGFKNELTANQYFILKGERSSALAHYDSFNQVIDRIEKQQTYGIAPRNAEQTFALDALLRPEVKLVALTGKAGTGKTLLALAAALTQSRDFHQIYLARPIVPLSNRDLGYLPGDAKEKINPYMQPLFDNLSVIKHCFEGNSSEYKRIEEMVKTEKLMITPLAYIRGRSLSKIFFIVDEAQNLTPHEIKTIITRAGEGTKMVFTGDIQQIDSPYLDAKSNGLSYMADKLKGQGMFAHVHLLRGERSALADLASDLL